MQKVFRGNTIRLLIHIMVEVLYRHNKINYFAANTDVNATATVYPTQPYLPTAVEPLANMIFTISGVPF